LNFFEMLLIIFFIVFLSLWIILVPFIFFSIVLFTFERL
jgi:hypothetical protein